VGKKVGWKSNFKAITLNPNFGARIVAGIVWDKEYEMQFCPILFTPRDFRKLAQAISMPERFRIILNEVRRAGHRIDHCLVNPQGEQKLLTDATFIGAVHLSAPKGQGHLGRFLGIDIFCAPQQSEMIVFVVETPQGFFTISGNDVQPFEHPGPIFIMEIKP
jgi:hypothetical protein